MSDENRDGETGQFTSTEPLTGLAGIERDAGYVPYVPLEEPRDETNALTIAEAVEQHVSGAPEAEIKTYDGIDLPDNVTLTVEQAENIITDMDAADHSQAELDENEATRKWHDDLLGVKPEAKAKAEAAKETTPAPADDSGLDPETAAALANPKIKAVIDQQIGESEAARQQYVTAVTAATQIAQATFLSQFPEFANVPEEQRGDALRAMMQNDPGRAQRLADYVQSTSRILQAQQAVEQEEAQTKQDKLKTYVADESARFEKMISHVPKAERAEVESEIVAAIKEYGGETAQFLKLMQSSEFSSATVQRLLYDVGKLRRIEKSKAAVAAKNLPPVLRPGTSRPAVSSDSARVQALNAKSELTVREATELVTLQSRRRA